jgi:twitching motility protein PilT
VVQAARETVTNATNAAVTAAVADTVPGAVADAARIAVENIAAAAVERAARNTAADLAPAVVSAAVSGAVADAVPGAVVEAVRNAAGDVAAAVSQAARETVAAIAPGAVVDAARAAVSAAAAAAVTDAAREIVAEVASAAVARAVPVAVIDAARIATAAVVLPAVEKAARDKVAEAVPSAVADMARIAVSEAAAAAVAHAAGETVARLAPAAVADAARIAVDDGAAAAVAKAARETVAEAAPAAMAAAVSAAVADAAPGAVADAARVAVADVAAAVVAKAVAAALSAAATAMEGQIASGDAIGAPPLSGERSSQPRTEVLPPGEVVKPLSAAVLEFAPSRLSPPRALPPERAPEAASARTVDTRLDLERLLRAAAARRTTTLYLFSNAQPSIWVEGQLQSMGGEPVFSAGDVTSLLLTTMREANREALRTGVATEWTRDVEGIGRVNCRTFSDHRGPGGVFRMPVPALTADQLGLTQDIQSLAQYPDGLILVADSRFSGRQMLTSALVDLINRTRQGYIITLEEEVSVVHETGRAVISQRQVRPNEDDLLAAAHSALRENPNVLLLDEIRTGASMNLALEAASSGRLIIAGLRARSASEAIDRIVGFYAPEHSRQVRLALVENLRGIVAQVLLTDRRGRRVAAREVVNTPGIAAFVTGETTEPRSSTTEGRRDRMVQLTDVLADYVEQGVVDVDEACRHVRDRSAFTGLLKGRGIDSGRKLPGSLG